jgi:hypothetical protein
VNNWANFGQLQMYGKDTPRRTAAAAPAWPATSGNAYIPANQINATNAAGRCT